MTTITRTEQADTITYTATIDGTDAAELVIWTATREIANVETSSDYQRQGLARALWTAANTEGECFHSLDHHRTPEGDAFAHAVGGDTISDTDGYQAECIICTGEMED
jgi:hypothetical protein